MRYSKSPVDQQYDRFYERINAELVKLSQTQKRQKPGQRQYLPKPS
jgi:hypothetical protein